MTEIRLHNSLTRRKEAFTPINPADVRMYVCGPTVYDRAHIGNARPVVVFDVLYRLLRHVYGADHVTYVRNITDIDDKINARAKETLQPGETPLQAIRRITDMTAGWFLDDMKALGALDPTHQPRATEFVPQMVAMIGELIAKGFAYEAESHVLFEVAKYAEYGRLSGRSTDDMIAGARVEVAPYKRDPMDFVLWKPSDADTPGWDSPWGRGRPGWHIECSAMSSELLGETFDIHGGGADLMFPHHENEIAQSCCAAPDAGFARVWMHNGMINVDGRKMSKSLGNFLTVADLRDQAPGEVLRLAMLMTHYRDALDWTAARLREAEAIVARWRRAKDVATASYFQHEADGTLQSKAVLEASLCNDLNTWNAIRGVDEMAKRLLNPSNDPRHFKEAGLKFLNGLDILGFAELHGENDERILGRLTLHEIHREEITRLLELRANARAERDFSKADLIRDKLNAAGVSVRDKAQEQVWSVGENFDEEAFAKLEALK